MRRLAALGLAALQLLLLTGRGGVRTNYREVEQLLVVQTLGLDGKEGGVTLTLAAKGDSEQGVRRMKAPGSSVTAAMDRIRASIYEEELFCAHAERLVVGEKTAEAGLDGVLAWLERSPEMRLDLPLYVVRGDTAERAMLEVGDEQRGICDAMDTADRAARRRGDCGLTTAADILRDSARFGSALICALSLRPAAEQDEKAEGALTAAPSGYAVLRGGKLVRFLNAEQAIAAGLLKNEPGLSEITVCDRFGRPAVIELSGGSSRIRPVWEGGALRGLQVEVQLRGSVAELSAGSSPPDTDELTARLEEKLASAVSAALQASRELRADYLGLAAHVERADPVRFRALTQAFPDLLPELQLEVTVRARLDHAPDRKEV
ncbi:MAG: Ger(x)C family spore germination C-terminal domain-containing protein [Eubacteriales bacterium]|nr:Ger(x)C family spore germination C-terminal domain-containing protein [Eubacteriales bacterium]